MILTFIYKAMYGRKVVCISEDTTSASSSEIIIKTDKSSYRNVHVALLYDDFLLCSNMGLLLIIMAHSSEHLNYRRLLT